MKFSDLWRWDGHVSRAAFATAGLVGVAIKHNLDRLIASSYLGNKNSFNYWAPLGRAARLVHLSDTEAKFLATLLLVSIPFIWVGVAMTVKRLRDAGQPIWLVVLFLCPVYQLAVFSPFCALPPHERSQELELAPWPGPHGIDRFIPHSKIGSATLSIVVATVLGFGFVVMGTLVIGAYGWGLFVALPFCLGVFSVLSYSYHEPREWFDCMGVALLPVVLGWRHASSDRRRRNHLRADGRAVCVGPGGAWRRARLCDPGASLASKANACYVLHFDFAGAGIVWSGARSGFASASLRGPHCDRSECASQESVE